VTPAKSLLVLLLICALAIGVGAVIGSTRAKAEVAIESARVPVIYLISVSRVAYPDEDVWLVRYAMDGIPYAVDVPIKDTEADGYLKYLRMMGRVYE